MHREDSSGLRLALGLFLAAAGAATLAAPRVVTTVALDPAIQPLPAAWGIVCLGAGALLAMAGLSAPRPAIAVWVHLAAGAALALLANGAASAGAPAEAVSYALLASLVMALPFFSEAAPDSDAAPTARGVRTWPLTWARGMAMDVLEIAPLALVIYLGANVVIQSYKVEGSSMEPSVHAGQYFWVNKAAYLTLDLEPLKGVLPLAMTSGIPLGSPGRGDVIVFRLPSDPARNLIKRVIALPGDSVEIREGRVLVNGQMLAEPYIAAPPVYARAPLTVKDGHYYVLGDNRNNSSDSHVWGLVPREAIIGKALVSYWPLGLLGPAPNHVIEVPR